MGKIGTVPWPVTLIEEALANGLPQKKEVPPPKKLGYMSSRLVFEGGEAVINWQAGARMPYILDWQKTINRLRASTIREYRALLAYAEMFTEEIRQAHEGKIPRGISVRIRRVGFILQSDLGNFFEIQLAPGSPTHIIPEDFAVGRWYKEHWRK